MHRGLAILLLALGLAAAGLGVWGEIATALTHGPTADVHRWDGFIFAGIPLLFGLGCCFVGTATWLRAT